MRAPTVKFFLDPVALTQLQQVADGKALSVSQLLRNLVYQAIRDNQATRQGRKAGNTNDEQQDPSLTSPR
jgi:hypothetical protein